jgi:hypothetical protein
VIRGPEADRHIDRRSRPLLELAHRRADFRAQSTLANAGAICHRQRPGRARHGNGALQHNHGEREGGPDVTVQEIVQTHPQPTSLDRAVLIRCITACSDCADSCTGCADADLAEPDVEDLVRCIRLCLDCSDICTTTGRIVTRQTAADVGVLRASVEACATVCRVCGDECERHASHHEHCRLCAESCRRCEEACRALLAALD